MSICYARRETDENLDLITAHDGISVNLILLEGRGLYKNIISFFFNFTKISVKMLMIFIGNEICLLSLIDHVKGLVEAYYLYA